MMSRRIFRDLKFWLEEVCYFTSEILYTLGECLAAVCYMLLLVFNVLAGNLHNDGVGDERRRLHEEQKKQKYWEEEKRAQLEFEEQQRLYALRFGNWRESHLAAITVEEREEAETVRDNRGTKLVLVSGNGRTAVATTGRVDQLKSDSERCRKRISRLYSEADYFRHQERASRFDDKRDLSRRVRDIEGEIANLERLDRQVQMDLQNMRF